ncbi:MAG: DUF4388 domain-containing protein [Myxococcales bacterium]
MGDERIRVTDTGGVSIAAPALKSRLATQAGEYRAHEGPNGTWLLLRVMEQNSGHAAVRVLMMGELIHRMTVVEIINLVMSSNWRGELHLVSPNGRRVLGVDQGALKYARTDFDSEHLGEILVRAGLIERGQLASALREQTADKRLGQMIVERGLVPQEALFKQLKRQAEIIFNGALLADRGMYWFVAHQDDAQVPPATVHLSIQGLLMEGVQQIDEMGLFRERIPHNGFYPTIVPNAPKSKAEGLDTLALEILLSCDGTCSIDDLTRARSIGEFPVLKAVYELLRAGQVTLRRGPRLDPKTAERLVRQFNELILDVFLVVATYGRMDATRRALGDWLASSPHGAILGHQLDIDGTLNAAQVIARLETGNDDPMTNLHLALQELATYALFIASNGLDRLEEQSLARDVTMRLKAMVL